MTATVIKFPKHNPRVEIELDEKDRKNKISAMRIDLVSDVMAELMPMIYDRLYVAGFDFGDWPESREPDKIKALGFVDEAFHSLLLKYQGVEHPFQLLSDELFKFEDGGDSEISSLTLVDRIELGFKDPNKQE